jgi:hypothetical protein
VAAYIENTPVSFDTRGISYYTLEHYTLMEVGMKKTVLLTAALLLLVSGALFAQNTDHRVFGMEVGFLGGYDLGASDTFAGRTFSFLLPVSDSMQFGLKAVNGTIQTAGGTGYVLMSAEYFLSPQLGVELLAGQENLLNNDVAGGANVFFNIMKNNPESGLSSSLKVQAGYLFDATDGVANGTLNVGLVGSFGM